MLYTLLNETSENDDTIVPMTTKEVVGRLI